MAKHSVTVWSSLQDHIAPYKMIICDLWGVVHNGEALFKPAVQAIENARSAGLQTVFLTNAPKPASVIRGQLADKGMEENLRDLLVTSGSQARDFVRQHHSGGRLFHMGPSMDHQATAGLPVTLTQDISDTTCIFASGLNYRTAEAHQDLLEIALKRGIPFLCANPDRVVHFGDKLYVCAGAVADIYETMGGTVHWFGKPTVGAFEACIKAALDAGGLDKAPDPSEILVIGDSLLTDIQGAMKAGHDSLLITTGIHRDSFEAIMETQVHWPALKGLPADDIHPTAVMENLAW